jgi:hypothetical protein
LILEQLLIVALKELSVRFPSFHASHYKLEGNEELRLQRLQLRCFTDHFNESRVTKVVSDASQKRSSPRDASAKRRQPTGLSATMIERSMRHWRLMLGA